MLKKGDWHESVREPVINYVKGHDRSGRPDEKRDHELKRGPTKRRSSNARQLGISRHEAAEVYAPEEHKHAETNPTCKTHEGYCASHKKIETKIGYICPGEPHQRSPNAPKFEDRSQEETEWQEQGAAKQRGSWPKVC